MVRGAPLPPDSHGRPTCYGCIRPKTHCICGFLSPFRAQCKVLILQHPNERKKYYSTSKLVLRSIANSRMIRELIFEPEVLQRVLAGSKNYLLFPGPSAIDCSTLSLDEESTIIAIDGTWSEAGKVLSRNPVLSTLPRVTFKQPLRSNYRIRKQPKPHCLSTVESIGHLLKINAESNGLHELTEHYDKLFEAFERMVEQQLQHFPRMRGATPR